MCVLECSCGMVVSTRGTRTRCIRCGAILGPCDVLEMKTEQIRGNCEARVPKEGPDQEADDADPRGEGRHAALAAYVSVVIIAAARALQTRTESV